MTEKSVVYEFGNFRLYAAQRILLRDGRPVALTGKSFDTLLVLLQANGRILEKDELMKAIWPSNFVEEGNLSQNIFVLRRLLGDKGGADGFIKTIPRRGYMFVAAVKKSVAEMSENGSAASPLLDEYWSRHSPFRGLQVFEPEDAWLFFGRETETDELLVRLTRSPVLTVVGNSGSGKSSLVRAGLIAALQAGRFQNKSGPVEQWRVALFRPSESPFDYLAEVLVHQLAPGLSLEARADFIAYCRNKLPLGGDALRNAISALAYEATHAAGTTHILLVADQFEEIFSLTSHQQTRQRYIDGLIAATRLDSAVPVHLVLVLRADFYPHCLEFAELSRSLETNLYNVPHMAHDQLRKAIERRLDLARAYAEPGLIDALLEDVGTEPGDLALLEHALSQLWEKSGGPGRTLSSRTYAEIGRIRGALGRHADEVYAGIGDERRKALARKIFLELVHLGEGAQDTRRRVPKAHLLTLGRAEEVEPLLQRLATRRLIATGGSGDKETFVEVAHEALIREWPALREWLAQDREDLRLERRLLQAADEWHNLNQDSGALLQGARLAQAEEWLAKHEDAPPLLQQFLKASIDAHVNAAQKEREAQERDLAQQKDLARLAQLSAVRFRRFSSALAVMLVVAVGAAWFAHNQQVLAATRALAAQAGELLPIDHGRALDLALRSWNMAKTNESRFAVAKTSPELLRILQHDNLVWWATFSPDGRLILTASEDHAARLWNVADGRLLATLKHDDAVPAAEFSPDGKRVATASADHTARVWNVADGRLLFTLQGHTDKVWGAEFSPDGRRIVTASSDHTARVWDSDDGHLVATLSGHTDAVACAKFSPDGRRIVTTSWDHTVRFWSSADGHVLTILAGHESDAIAADFFPFDNRVVTTGFDNTARVWDSTGRLLFTLHHDGPVVAASVSPDGLRIATASRDHKARIWDTSNGHLLFTLPHDGPVVYASFSPDGRHVITASHDQAARLWSAMDGRLLAIFQGHTSTVYTAVISPDGQHIVTASFDHTARLWNVGPGPTVAVLGHTGWVYSAAISKDGKRVVTASFDHTARIWNSTTGRLLATLPGHEAGLLNAEFSPDDQRIVTASVDHTARLWNAVDGRPLATLQGHSRELLRAHFSPDGQRVVTASRDHTARVWNASDGRALATLQGHSDEIFDARFSPDGQRIVTAGKDHTARVWSVGDGRLLFTLEGHTGEIREARFSPDGLRILTASGDQTAKIWNSNDGHLLLTLQGHTGDVYDAEFSPDSKSIVTGSKDHTARIWNSSNGNLMAILQGHTDTIWWAVFSPDGRHILTTSHDCTLRMWDSLSGELQGILQGHTGEITAVAFSPDGQRVVTSSLDQTARVWQLLTLDDVERILSK